MSILKKILIALIAGALLGAAYYYFLVKKQIPAASQPEQTPTLTPTLNPSQSPVSTLYPSPTPTFKIEPNQATPTPENSTALVPPISSELSRVTKKPFGIYVSPGNSPVSPEKFTGYHTGVDFETLPSEQDIDVPISAACDGAVLYKNWVSGYGGVMIQSCKLENQDVTVLYGHLKLSSVGARVGQKISAGEKIGILGKGYSVETDGERKHLHLGVHKGAKINFLGYVQNQADLSGWIDALKYLK